MANEASRGYMKRERQLLGELGGTFRSRNAFWAKLADMPHFEGAQFRFDIGKPFDGFGQFAGHAFVIEAKYIPRFKPITESMFRPCQLAGLDGWVKSGGRAFAFIFLWEGAKGRKSGAGALRSPKAMGGPMRRLYAIDWARFRAGGSSITRGELVAMPHIARRAVKTPEGTAYQWDIDGWLVDLIMGS